MQFTNVKVANPSPNKCGILRYCHALALLVLYFCFISITRNDDLKWLHCVGIHPVMSYSVIRITKHLEGLKSQLKHKNSTTLSKVILIII